MKSNLKQKGKEHDFHGNVWMSFSVTDENIEEQLMEGVHKLPTRRKSINDFLNNELIMIEEGIRDAVD